MDIIKSGFGEQLKTFRKIRHYTQEKLADEIGINLRQMARIEAGESFITSETLYKICTILDIEPWELFNFEIYNEKSMTGTDNVVYLNVIKGIDGTHIVSQKPKAIDTNAENPDNDFDKRMQNMATRLRKDIVVDEFKDGVLVEKKCYKFNGEIESTKMNQKNIYNILKEKITSISNDNKKLEFVNLALDSLSNKTALSELKILIKGIELTQA